MRSRHILAGFAAVLVIPAWAQGLPRDAAVNAAAPNKTLEPRVITNSGRLEWLPHAQDLTTWPSLSHEDRRPPPKPRKVRLSGPLGGDAARGRELALRPDKGFCIVCHQLPGEAWPGTVGLDLRGFRQRQYADAAVYQQIFDARVHNPHTVMPPYGSNNILSDQEIRDLVAYLQSLE